MSQNCTHYTPFARNIIPVGARAIIALFFLIAAASVVAACKGTDKFPPLNPDPVPDAPPPCDFNTCASVGASCGPIGDGCSNRTIDCGSCPDGQTCGGDGPTFSCGSASACVPHDCGTATCGRISDGCGGLTDSCGTCPTGEVCGVVTANQCGVKPCTGLCLAQDACPAQPHTTITGTVTAPGHDETGVFGDPDPISGALVYIPNGAAGPPSYGVTAFPKGVTCDTCSSIVSGAPLVSTTTAVDGTFTLLDAPCGSDIPLVIQLGRWRRQIVVPAVACCAATALTNKQTHLPRDQHGEPGDLRSDIPLTAFSTGDVDTLHCVLRKMGVDDAEFTNPNGSGRIHLYTDNGARINASTPPATVLTNNSAELDKYDVAMFECTGERDPKTANPQSNLIKFANAGGRIFATHFSYVWLTNSNGNPSSNTGPKPFSQTAQWSVDQAAVDFSTAVVDVSPQSDPETQARRVSFAKWLELVGAADASGQIGVAQARHDFNSVSTEPATEQGTPAQLWMSSTDPDFEVPLTYSFDTPVSYNSPPTERCGRVLYNDFHVSDATSNGMTFPAECTNGPMTAQEKTLEFMIFDLATCTGPQPSDCAPRSCSEQGFDCGLAGDGCDDGATLFCGTCANGRFCGGAGPNRCGTGLCVPLTCESASFDCGIIGDGCGGSISCGDCAPESGDTCGGGGDPNKCGSIFQ